MAPLFDYSQLTTSRDIHSTCVLTKCKMYPPLLEAIRDTCWHNRGNRWTSIQLLIVFYVCECEAFGLYLPPATKLGQGNIFRSVCPHSVHRGACMVAPGGHVWLLRGVHGCSGGIRGYSQGVCGCSGGHAWLPRGACMVARGGMCGCSGGMRGCSLGGHAWLLPGGMHGCSGGHAWLLPGHAWLLWGVCGCSGGHAWDMMRYGDTVNERAVRILLECILV